MQTKHWRIAQNLISKGASKWNAISNYETIWPTILFVAGNEMYEKKKRNDSYRFYLNLTYKPFQIMTNQIGPDDRPQRLR